MNQTEFEALLLDQTKQISSDIFWSDDEDHSPCQEFRVEVNSSPGYPLFVKGSCNFLANTLSYTLVHKGSGRIYALDMGKDHHNPCCTFVGEIHKHRWNEPVRDKEAYVPLDITSPTSDPVAVWNQFCAEAQITHHGIMHTPAPVQLDLL